jgi:hypothetical protein
MLDEVNILTPIEPPIQVLKKVTEPFYYNDILMAPKWSNGNLSHYAGKHQNLHVSISNGYLKISNSWHKFLKGNNHSDFYCSEIKEAAYQVKDFFKITLNDTKVQKITYGCVIDHNPEEIYSTWMRYKNKEALPMTNKGVIYGAKFQLSDFNLKGYNKSFEVKKHDNIDLVGNYFRIEAEVNYMRHLYNRSQRINIHNPEDLFNYEIIQLLAKDLFTKYKTIEKMESINFSCLSPEEIKIASVMKDPQARDAYKKAIHKRTFGRQLKKFKEIIKDNQDNSAIVEGKIFNKLLDLVNG